MSAKQLEQCGAACYAASLDTPELNRAFAGFTGSRFPILCDVAGDVARAYGVIDDQRELPARWTFFIDSDGRIAAVINASPPRELDLGERPLPRVSIFMNVFDCHVNRSPVTGRIDEIVYHAGSFISADLDKASEENERNSFVISTGGTRIAVVQIAGLVARRIVCFVRKGATVGAGERIGMIRFGSRVDVYLPEGVRPLVAEGQIAIAGETVIADLRAGDRDRTFRVG